MRKSTFIALAAALAIFATAQAQAGFISSIRDKITGNDSQQVPQQQMQQNQATPPPAEQAGRSQPVDKQKIREGAAKLAKELNWDRPPADLFQRYAGAWVGHFWVYSPLGKKEEVHKVRIEYTPQSDGTLKMLTNSFDLLSKTWVVQESAVYSISGDTINVTITRPSGKASRQVGHYSDGEVFLQAQISDGVEHFRERIDGKRLLVDGFGVYDSLKSKNEHIFIGRFLKE
jgi:hypothetical protein